MRFIFLLILLTMTANTYAATGAEVLRFPIGARANGMAEAQIAVANGIDAIYNNPACLAKGWCKEASFSCIDGLMDTSISSILYGQPTQKGYLAGGLTSLNGGRADINWHNGSIEDIQPENDWVATMAYGKQITENSCIGYGLKVIYSNLAERETAIGFGLDIGCLYRKKGFSTAIVLSNAGLGLKYYKKRDDLPLCLKFGMGGKVYARKSNSLLLVGDLIWYNNEDLGLSAGLEYNYANILFLRTGYKIPDNKYTLGLGWKVGKCQLDYAYYPLENLESNHRMSLRMLLPSKK
ncbi:MAG: PorV/PorQ family protein [Candidatus Desantisbacteria bacterium]